MKMKSCSSAKKLTLPPVKKLKSPPAKKLRSPAKKVKEHVSCSHIDADVGVSDSVPANGIKPDVVIEIEESEAAKEREHVIIAIENPNPELEVQIVVGKKNDQVFQLDYSFWPFFFYSLNWNGGSIPKPRHELKLQATWFNQRELL